MHRKHACCFLLFTLLTSIVAAGCSALRPASVQSNNEPTAVGVISFNIRYGTADDGPNRWRHRREAVIELIDRRGEDFVGLQEALRFQIDEVVAGVPRYAFVGVGRDDGKDAGEFCAILYDQQEWKPDPEHTGTFWLSKTTDVIGSASWGNSIPRIATHARLVRIGEGEPRAIWVFNTHFDHQSENARVNSAALLRRRIDERANPDEPFVLTGDFNAGERSDTIDVLRQGHQVKGDRPAPLVVDSFRVAHPDATDVGTFCGFDPANTSGDKIDYVFVEPGARVIEAAIVRDAVPGDATRAPSDHFPVTARVAWPAK